MDLLVAWAWQEDMIQGKALLVLQEFSERSSSQELRAAGRHRDLLPPCFKNLGRTFVEKHLIK